MRTPSIAPAYAFIYPLCCEAARTCGYALALHGTMARDLDLLAVPWTEEAADCDTLIDAIMKACDGFLIERTSKPEPERKPHGRMAWSIHLDGGVFIDLSVMPRVSK